MIVTSTVSVTVMLADATAMMLAAMAIEARILMDGGWFLGVVLKITEKVKRGN